MKTSLMKMAVLRGDRVEPYLVPAIHAQTITVGQVMLT